MAELLYPEQIVVVFPDVKLQRQPAAPKDFLFFTTRHPDKMTEQPLYVFHFTHSCGFLPDSESLAAAAV
jgi:hypothetical protein